MGARLQRATQLALGGAITLVLLIGVACGSDDGENAATNGASDTKGAVDATGANVLHLFFSPAVRFLKFYVMRMGFLDGLPGLLHISIGCMNSYVKYMKLIELRQSTNK